jgi:hypothetical protein
MPAAKAEAFDRLAVALKSMGRIDDAREVLYQAGWERFYAASIFNKIIIAPTFLTGFGQKPFWLIPEAIFLLIFGYGVLYWSMDFCSIKHRQRYINRYGYHIIFVSNVLWWAMLLPFHRLISVDRIRPIVTQIFLFMSCNCYGRLIFSLDNGLPTSTMLLKFHERYTHRNNRIVQGLLVLQKLLGYFIVLLAITAIVQAFISK